MVIFLPTNIIGSIIVKKWQVKSFLIRKMPIVSKLLMFQIEQMKLKDERTKMTNEVLNGIKVGDSLFIYRLFGA